MIVQPTVSHYRAPLIEALLDRQAIDFKLFGRRTNSEDRQSVNHIKSANVELLQNVDILASFNWGPLRWEKGVVSSIFSREYDAFVLEGRVYTVSTWIALLLGRIRRVPVFLWGHGWKRPESGTKLLFRRGFYKLSSGLLLYGDWARNFAVAVGIEPKRVAVVGYSIYRQSDISNVESKNKSRFRIASDPFTVIVSVRLTRRHRIDFLAESISRMASERSPVQVIVVGEGTERESLETLFRSKGIRSEFLGAVYGAERLAEVYNRAHVSVSPRASGLNIVQPLGFGVPVIAPACDPTSGPESELVENGETGLTFALDDVDDLARQLELLRARPDLADSMGKAGKTRILRTHTAEAHASSIESAIDKWLVPENADDT